MDLGLDAVKFQAAGSLLAGSACVVRVKSHTSMHTACTIPMCCAACAPPKPALLAIIEAAELQWQLRQVTHNTLDLRHLRTDGHYGSSPLLMCLIPADCNTALLVVQHAQ